MRQKKFNKREILIGILITFFSLLIIGLLMEIVLRISGYNPLKNNLAGRENILRKSSDPERRYEAVPDAEGWVWNTFIKINSYGFRDRNYRPEKKEGIQRIIVLGDSITFGTGMKLDDIYTERLEELFSRNGMRVEVLNLSLPGYDTLAEVNMLEKIGILFRPDMVILGYCINDIMLTPAPEEIIRMERYSSFIYKLRLIQFIVNKLDKFIQINRLKRMNLEKEFLKSQKMKIVNVRNDRELMKYVDNLRNLLKERGYKDYNINLYTSLPHLGKFRYSIERLKKLSNLYNFKVVVMIISYLGENEVNKEIYKSVYKIIKYESERVGFSVINTRDTFNTVEYDKLQTKKDDFIHPNKLGHELMAKMLYNYLTSNYFNN